MTQCISTSRDAQVNWLRPLEDNAEPAPLYAWTLANLGKASDTNPLSRLPDSDSKRRIFILGVGNLGRLFASSLAKLPNPPPITLVVHRRDLLERWHSSPGIEMTRDGKVDKSCLDVDMEWWTEDKPASGPSCQPGEGRGISNLIVATKANDSLPQVDRLRGYLTSKSTVAFTQNGMCPLWPPRGVDYTTHRWPDGGGPNWIACVTTHGVTSLGPFQSLHASQAAISVGPVLLNHHQSDSDSSAYLIDQLVHAPHLGGKAVSRGDLWMLQLEKLVVNSVINPLTAILHCKNGDIFTARGDDTLSRVIDSLIQEASRVLQALVLEEYMHSSSSIINGEEDMDHLLRRFSFDSLRAMVLDVGFKVRDNTSSMLQDVLAGRTTEIRAFNGWLVETAALLDKTLRLSTHERLISLVEAGIWLKHGETERLLSS